MHGLYFNARVSDGTVNPRFTGLVEEFAGAKNILDKKGEIMIGTEKERERKNY